MVMTAAEMQKDYRARQKAKKLTESANAPQPNAPLTEKESVSAMSAVEALQLTNEIKEMEKELHALAIGPLDVYSERRWAFLQSRGHTWDQDRQRSIRQDTSQPNGYVVGVVVPGDPAYQGVAS